MSEVPLPTDAMPTTRTLLRTTMIAAVVAFALVIGVVLPAEYGVDPTGVGRVLGLTQMGKLKLVLMREEAALQNGAASAAVSANASSSDTLADASMRRDSIAVTIPPQEGVEVKLAMSKGQLAFYSWTTDSGAVFFDLHGEGPSSAGNPSQSYGQGSLRRADGELVAAFDGNHGWYWKNSTKHEVRVTVKAWGHFQDMRKM